MLFLSIGLDPSTGSPKARVRWGPTAGDVVPARGITRPSVAHGSLRGALLHMPSSCGPLLGCPPQREPVGLTRPTAPLRHIIAHGCPIRCARLSHARAPACSVHARARFMVARPGVPHPTPSGVGEDRPGAPSNPGTARTRSHSARPTRPSPVVARGGGGLRKLSSESECASLSAVRRMSARSVASSAERTGKSQRIFARVWHRSPANLRLAGVRVQTLGLG